MTRNRPLVVVHAKGFAVRNSGGFFFTWTPFALAATGWVTMVLAARGIWQAIRDHDPRFARSRSLSSAGENR